jgi:DNA-binding NarL/FixJ family response regulator
MRILLVEDHEATREEMRLLIDSQGDLDVVAEAGSGEKAVEEAARTMPDLIVMDIVLPGINGVEATQTIVARQPGVKVVVLSNYSGQALVRAVLQAGGLGYVRKERAFQELIPAIRGVASGRQYLGLQTSRIEPPSDISVPSVD